MPVVNRDNNTPNNENEVDENLVDCVECSEQFDENDCSNTSSSESVCASCYEDCYYTCDSCGDVDHVDYSYRSPSEGYYCECCRDNSFSYCDDCEEPVWHDDQMETEDGSYVCESCYNDNFHGESADTFVKDSPTNPQVEVYPSGDYDKLNVRRLVGVEAECVFGDCETGEEGNPMALHNIPKGWREAYDGSISGNGREMISTPSNGNILWTRVKQLENWAKEHNVYINRSCGLHVHLDATDTTWQDLKAISLVMMKVEQHIFDMLPPSRQNSNWCKRISMNINELIACSTESEFVELWYRNESINRTKYNDTRYHGLNLHARFYLGTIEFRYHSGTLNSNKILNWIKICNAVMETGIKLSRDSKWTDGHKFYYETKEIEFSGVNQRYVNLSELFSHMIGIDKNTASYMVDRMRLFNPNAVHFETDTFTDLCNTINTLQ